MLVNLVHQVLETAANDLMGLLGPSFKDSKIYRQLAGFQIEKKLSSKSG
jgi:hypothetical protein